MILFCIVQIIFNVIIFFRDHVVVLHHHHLQHLHLLHPHLLHPHHHQAVVVDLLNGKVTIIVMMTTTMQPVDGMVVIAVVMM